MPQSIAPALPDASDTVVATPRLQASWRRSHDLGVPVDVVEPTYCGGYDVGSLLNRCGSQVLRDLQSTLATEPISLMVADRDGLVLSRLCNDAAIAASLDRVHLAPGFSYAERHAGTNGLGLSLVDRAPVLVRAEEHYCTALRGYTCAAAPVFDLRDGEIAGTINLTTWSASSPTLLLALAQSAAANTSTLMAVRSLGRAVPAPQRSEPYDVRTTRPGADRDPCASPLWRRALADAEVAADSGRLIAAVGEPGAGKTRLLVAAHGNVPACDRVLTARVPDAEGVQGWLDVVAAESRREGTVVVVTGVDRLPGWAADELGLLTGPPGGGGYQPIALSAGCYDDIPTRLAALVDAVVEVPPLRRRSADVMSLASHFAAEERHRPVTFTPSAAQALRHYEWPGNLRQLRRVVCAAAARADVVDVRHLDPEVLSSGAIHLSRIETFERDELIRCLSAPGATVASAASELGISRATAYRKVAQYGIRLPGRAGA